MIYSEQKDEQLVQLTLSGDQQAYEALVIRWQRAVLNAANVITQNRYSAEDAAQDAFVSAWMKLDSLREPERFGAWVCRIAKNRAKNIVIRYKECLGLDDLLNLEETAVCFPEELIGVSDPYERLHDSVSALPEKVRRVVYLHYFEGLSLAEIADRTREPIGTVKWRVSEGRRLLRKDLGAVNEREEDTFVEKVMKKIEELKKWRLKGSRKGFESAYTEVLAEVEKLPESSEKYHAMADVLQMGWWWLPGEKNDQLKTRMKEAAEKGGNLEVLGRIIRMEDDKLTGRDKIEFMRDKQIPLLEKLCYPEALAEEWFWLGFEYRNAGESDAALDAFGRVLEIAPPACVVYGNAKAAIECESWAREVNPKWYNLGANGEEYRVIDGIPRFWSEPGYHVGECFEHSDPVTYLVSRCDSFFFDPAMRVDDVKISSDGKTTLTFKAVGATAQTPCGSFEDCQVWVTEMPDGYWRGSYTAFYQAGVGLVRLECKSDESYINVLNEYTVCGGKGLLPFAVGNRWCYGREGERTDYCRHESVYEVTACEENRVFLSCIEKCQRIRWDEHSWNDTMLQMRNAYVEQLPDGGEQLIDVRPLIDRAERLASTPYEKAHTKAAALVMRRILDTDLDLTPDAAEKGYWNFFQRYDVVRKDGTVRIHDERRRYSFEWKNRCADERYPLMMNFMLSILQDTVGCIWSPDWIPGMESVMERTVYGHIPITVNLRVTNAGTVATVAGSFENCLCLALHIKGFEGGLKYQGDYKTFCFAPGVGAVRMVSADSEGKENARYELAAYDGVGEGYCPIYGGMLRRYEAVGTAEGVIGGVEYTCAASPTGSLVLFADQIGVKKI